MNNTATEEDDEDQYSTNSHMKPDNDYDKTDGFIVDDEADLGYMGERENEEEEYVPEEETEESDDSSGGSDGSEGGKDNDVEDENGYMEETMSFDGDTSGLRVRHSARLANTERKKNYYEGCESDEPFEDDYKSSEYESRDELGNKDVDEASIHTSDEDSSGDNDDTNSKGWGEGNEGRNGTGVEGVNDVRDCDASKKRTDDAEEGKVPAGGTDNNAPDDFLERNEDEVDAVNSDDNNFTHANINERLADRNFAKQTTIEQCEPFAVTKNTGS